jgi:hypothetical protein
MMEGLQEGLVQSTDLIGRKPEVDGWRHLSVSEVRWRRRLLWLVMRDDLL